MTVLSVLRRTPAALPSYFFRFCVANGAQPTSRALSTSVVRSGGHGPRTMVILPSRYQWQKYKDSFHFYLFLGVIPLLCLVTYCNVFIGPATLSEIPPGYRPKEWEYHKHPISRFFAKYLTIGPQEAYERNLHYIMEADEARRMRLLAQKVERLMAERGDYPNYYSSKNIIGKYVRHRVEEDRYVESIRGEE